MRQTVAQAVEASGQRDFAFLRLAGNSKLNDQTCAVEGLCDLHSRGWLWNSKLDDQEAGVASEEAHERSSLVRWMLSEKPAFASAWGAINRLVLRQSTVGTVEARGQGAIKFMLHDVTSRALI